MTRIKGIIPKEKLKQILSVNGDYFLKPLVQMVLQEMLAAEMNETTGAAKGERADGRFIVVGKKDAAVTRKAAELGIENKVIQTGWLTEDQLSDWLACADLCLLPMKDHPINQARWPNKIGFYMAAGRPTVATGIGDVGRLIAERKIGMVSRLDPQDFAEQVLYLFQHPHIASDMGLRARQLAETEFAPPIQGAEVERLYLNILGEHHG